MMYWHSYIVRPVPTTPRPNPARRTAGGRRARVYRIQRHVAVQSAHAQLFERATRGRCCPYVRASVEQRDTRQRRPCYPLSSAGLGPRLDIADASSALIGERVEASA